MNQQLPLYLPQKEMNARFESESLILSSALLSMQSVEDWVIPESAEVIDALSELFSRIEKKGTQKTIASAAADLILLLAHSPASLTIHVLGQMEERSSGSSVFLIQSASRQFDSVAKNHSEIDGSSSILIERIGAIFKMNALNRIFSANRLRFLISVIKESQMKINQINTGEDE